MPLHAASTTFLLIALGTVACDMPAADGPLLEVPFSAEAAATAITTAATSAGLPARVEIPLGRDAAMPLRLIPPGRITVGNEIVVIPAAYYIAETELTIGQRRALLAKDAPRPGHPLEPAELSSYAEVLDLMREAQARTGLSFRLPSEAEWEHAARAGADGRYGRSGDNPLQRYNLSQWNADPAGYRREGTPRETLTRVGSFGANDFGIVDAIGNVTEVVAAGEAPWSDLFAFTKGGSVLFSAGFSDRRPEAKASFAPLVGVRLAVPLDAPSVRTLAALTRGADGAR